MAHPDHNSDAVQQVGDPTAAAIATPQPQVKWRRQRWWHTLIYQLFWPAMLVGTLYSMLFFFINSSLFARVLSSQMNAMFEGHWEFERVRIGPAFNRLGIWGVGLWSPDGVQVIAAREIQVRYGLEKLLRELVNDSRLDLPEIEVKGAKVFLDFSVPGRFNLTSALNTGAPPKPPDPEPGAFVLALSHVNLTESEVKLDFGVFEVDLHDVDIQGFSLGIAGGVLTMNIPKPASPEAHPGLSIGSGRAQFNPRMFGFGLGRFGEAGVGVLLGEGGGGTAGTLGMVSKRAATALRRRPTDEAAAKIFDGLEAEYRAKYGAPHAQRGLLDLTLGPSRVEGFWWEGDRYGFSRVWLGLVQKHPDRTHDGQSRAQGFIALTDSMMDLSPKDTPINNPIGYEAHLDLRLLPGNDVLTYFVGSVAQAQAPIDLTVNVTGDLSQANGDVCVSAPALKAAGMDITAVAINATLRGQHITLDRLTARALAGDIWGQGFIKLLDGDMDIELALGQHPPSGRAEGLKIDSLLPPEIREQFGGRLFAHVRLLMGKNLGIGVVLEGPLVVNLDQPLPYSGSKQVVLRQGLPVAPGRRRPPSDNPQGALLSWKHQVLRLHDGLTLTADPEQVRIDRGLTFWPDTLRFTGLKAQVTGDNLGRMSALIGQPISTGPFSVRVALDGTPKQMQGSASIRLTNTQYQTYKLRSLALDARLSSDTVHLDRLELDSPLGWLSVKGSATVFAGALDKVRADIPLSLDITAERLALADIGALIGQPLKGEASLNNIKVRGSTKSPQVEGDLAVTDLRAMGEEFKRIAASFTLNNNTAKVKNLEILHGNGSKDDASFKLDADYDLHNHTFRINAKLSQVRAHEIPSIKALLPKDLGVRAQLDLSLEAEGDTDSFLGGRIERRLYAKGNILLSGIEAKGLPLGEVILDFYTHDDIVRIEGRILDLLKVTASIDSWRPLSAEAELGFYRLSVLDELERFKPLYTTVDPLAPPPLVLPNAAPSLLRGINVTGAIKARYDERSGGLGARIELERLQVGIANRVLENRLPIAMNFRDDTLTIEHLDIGTGDHQLALAGTATLGGELALDLSGQLDMSLLQILDQQVNLARGALSLTLSARGDLLTTATPKSPSTLDLAGLTLDGELAVSKPVRVELRALPSNEPLELSAGRIKITHEEVSIPSQNPLQIKALGGRAEVSGGLKLKQFKPASASLGLKAENITYHVPGTAMVTLDIPTLSLRASDLARLSPDTFQLRGEVKLNEGRFYQDFNIQQDFLREQVLNSWIKGESNVARADVNLMRKVPILQHLFVDVKLIAPDSFVVDNTIASAKVDIELGFNLHLQGPLKDNFRELTLNGDVGFKAGTIVFRGRKFDIQSSSQVSFTGPLEPRLDIAAQAEIDTQQNFMSTVVGSTNLDRRRQIRPNDIARASRLYTIILGITGKLSELEISLESNPFLPANDIFTLILTGQTLDQISAGGDDSPAFSVAFQTLIAPFVEAQIGKAISADAIKFSIAGGAAQLMYIQQLTNKLRVSGGVSLAGSDSNQVAVGAEYKFFDNLSIESTGQSTSNQGTTLNLRLRYHQSLD